MKPTFERLSEKELERCWLFILRGFCHSTIYHTGLCLDSAAPRLASTLLAVLINSHTMSMTVNRESLPTLRFSTCQPPPESNKHKIHWHRKKADLCHAIFSLFCWHSQICHSNKPRFQDLTEFIKVSLTSPTFSLLFCLFLFLPPTPDFTCLCRLPLSILFSFVQTYELSVLPAIPIIAPCSVAGIIGVKSELRKHQSPPALGYLLRLKCLSFAKLKAVTGFCGMCIPSQLESSDDTTKWSTPESYVYVKLSITWCLII